MGVGFGLGIKSTSQQAIAADIDLSDTISLPDEIENTQEYIIELTLSQFKIIPKYIGEDINIKDIIVKAKTNSTQFENTEKIPIKEDISLHNNKKTDNLLKDNITKIPITVEFNEYSTLLTIKFIINTTNESFSITKSVPIVEENYYINDDFSSNDIKDWWTKETPGASIIRAKNNRLEYRGGRNAGGSLSDRPYLITSEKIIDSSDFDISIEGDFYIDGSEQRVWFMSLWDGNSGGRYNSPSNAVHTQITTGGCSLRVRESGNSNTIDSTNNFEADLQTWYNAKLNLKGSYTNFEYQVIIDDDVILSGNYTNFNPGTEELPYLGLGGREYGDWLYYDNIVIK